MGYVSNIYGLILSIESVYNHVEKLSDEISEKIVANLHDTIIREKLKIRKSQLMSLNPFSARNYFDVNRATLTSMLSVRLVG